MSVSYSNVLPDEGRVPVRHLVAASTIGAAMWAVAVAAVWWAL